jgi:hypothetical protein
MPKMAPDRIALATMYRGEWQDTERLSVSGIEDENSLSTASGSLCLQEALL